jgi:hypothetical protein
MPFNDLHGALAGFKKSLDTTERLILDSSLWMTIRPPRGIPRFTVHHKIFVIELSFLRAFLAWEFFLEETFILYLLGKTAPRGRAPTRIAFPPNRKKAEQLLLPEDYQYIKWTIAAKVAKRAERFFRNGRPFAPALSTHFNTFDEMRILRNAIAHSQSSAQEKFKALVRRKSSTGTYPPRLTVGGFLEMTVPAVIPPETFFSNYINKIRATADNIVPN